MAGQIQTLQEMINQVVKGKQKVVEKVLCAMLAGGHILLEDIPGVGKTTLAMAIAKATDLTYRRVQFTPDVLPSDLVGFSMYNEKTKEFEYREGAVFANLFLADEINRTSPKTQSALLEAMEEEKVTVDGITHNLPAPFTVIATENPIGSSGTQMLPESQLDGISGTSGCGGYFEKQWCEITFRHSGGGNLSRMEKIAKYGRRELCQRRNV